MSFNTDFASNVDQDSVEEINFGASFPLIIYGYGDSKIANKVDGFDGKGGFFIDSERLGTEGAQRDELTAALIEAGWTKDTRTLQSGAEIEGLYKFDIEAAIIHFRKRWEASHKSSEKVTFAPFPDGAEGFKIREELVNEFDSVTGRIQLLVVLRGMDHPFVLTLGGSAQYAMTKTFIPEFMRTMLQTLSAKSKGTRFPLRTFYMHLSPTVDAKGKNMFEEVGKGSDTSFICKPSIVGLPNPGDATSLDAAWTKYFVGQDNVVKGGMFDEIYHSHKDWASAWDNFTGSADDASDLHNGQLAQPAAENAADLIAEAGI